MSMNIRIVSPGTLLFFNSIFSNSILERSFDNPSAHFLALFVGRSAAALKYLIILKSICCVAGGYLHWAYGGVVPTHILMLGSRGREGHDVRWGYAGGWGHVTLPMLGLWGGHVKYLKTRKLEATFGSMPELCKHLNGKWA